MKKTVENEFEAEAQVDQKKTVGTARPCKSDNKMLQKTVLVSIIDFVSCFWHYTLLVGDSEICDVETLEEGWSTASSCPLP